MLHPTKGIVIHTIRYRESSIITHIYTEQFGLQHYIVNSVFTKKSKAVYFQALCLLDLVVYHKENQGLKRLKDYRFQRMYTDIPFDMVKRSIAQCIAEILYKSIREEEENAGLFEFLFDSLTALDLMEEGTANFLIWFLIQLSYHLGFGPQYSPKQADFLFALQDGRFTSEPDNRSLYLSNEISAYLKQFLPCNLQESTQIKLGRKDRIQLTEGLLKYYQMHIENFGKLKSLPVMISVFNSLNDF